MKHRKTPQGEQGREEARERLIADQTFLIFQSALARRRVNDIMLDGDLTAVVHHRSLEWLEALLGALNENLTESKRWLLGAGQSEVDDRPDES